jgi:hypothetical protein
LGPRRLNYYPNRNKSELDLKLNVYERTNSQFKQAEGESEEEEEDDIPYGLGFFHLVFSMGAMYFAMIFVGWNANASHTMERQVSSIDHKGPGMHAWLWSEYNPLKMIHPPPQVDDRRRVGEHVGARRQRVAGGNRVQ